METAGGSFSSVRKLTEVALFLPCALRSILLHPACPAASAPRRDRPISRSCSCFHAEAWRPRPPRGFSGLAMPRRARPHDGPLTCIVGCCFLCLQMRGKIGFGRHGHMYSAAAAPAAPVRAARGPSCAVRYVLRAHPEHPGTPIPVQGRFHLEQSTTCKDQKSGLCPALLARFLQKSASRACTSHVHPRRRLSGGLPAASGNAGQPCLLY